MIGEEDYYGAISAESPFFLDGHKKCRTRSKMFGAQSLKYHLRGQWFIRYRGLI